MADATLTSELVVAEAVERGATLAGIASFDAVIDSPSSQTAPVPGHYEGAALAGIASAAASMDSPSGQTASLPNPYQGVGRAAHPAMAEPGSEWRHRACSVLVLAVAHPRKQPELDWWRRGQPGGTPGNHQLIRISRRLCDWLGGSWGVKTRELPYFIERGGIYLKDAAVLAGLGCLGKNNLLLTPEFGPRVRLRALLIDQALDSTGSSAFDPCETCDMPCRRVCPQGAFADTARFGARGGPRDLPARTGHYDRLLCRQQMEQDIERSRQTAVPELAKGGSPVHYCRKCEWACPVGRHDDPV